MILTSALTTSPSTATTRAASLLLLLGRRAGATNKRSSTTMHGIIFPAASSSAASSSASPPPPGHHRRRRPTASVVAPTSSVASWIIGDSHRVDVNIVDGRRRFHESATTMSSSSYRQSSGAGARDRKGNDVGGGRGSYGGRRRGGGGGGGIGNSNKDLFTPSPFARSSRIVVNDEFAVVRELMGGSPEDVYGMRRYLLLPISSHGDGGDVVASLHANKNVLFGSRLHPQPHVADDDDRDHRRSRYLHACGILLDVAREDASINGQQVQALASLDGLCEWASSCLDADDGGGSDVIVGLMTTMRGGAGGGDDGGKGGTRRTPPSSGNGGGRTNHHIITPPSPSSTTILASLGIKDEDQRKKMLDAIRSIATGRPRPGHTVVGAGTYRDGMRGWVALAREYARLATTTTTTESNDEYGGTAVMDTPSPPSLRVGEQRRFKTRGPVEVALYASRSGEVTAIEHLAHTTPEYLKEAGGAMARIFFV